MFQNDTCIWGMCWAMELENGSRNLKLYQTVHINFLRDLVDYCSESCLKYYEMLKCLTMLVSGVKHCSLNLGAPWKIP